MSHRAGVALTAAAAMAALTLSGALPVGASPAATSLTPGWRVVFSHHYRPINPMGAYVSVIAPARNDAWAFGGSFTDASDGYPVAAHWNGRRWQAAALPAGLHGWIHAVGASSPTDVWAASYLNGFVLHFNGVRWSVAKRLSASRQITGITVISPTNVWVFGDSGSFPGDGTWHFNGRHWTKITGIGRGINTASAVTRHNIWAFGGIREPNDSVEHYNGRSWVHVTVPALTGLFLRAVLALTADDVWVAGNGQLSDQQVAVLEHWNGRQWHEIIVPGSVVLERLIADGTGGLWLTVQSVPQPTKTWILHRSRFGRWTRTQIASNTEIADLALIPGTTSVWGSGRYDLGDFAAIFAHGRAG